MKAYCFCEIYKMFLYLINSTKLGIFDSMDLWIIYILACYLQILTSATLLVCKMVPPAYTNSISCILFGV